MQNKLLVRPTVTSAYTRGRTKSYNGGFIYTRLKPATTRSSSLITDSRFIEGSNDSLRERRFNQLVKQWRLDMRFESSTTVMATHPAYQQIIGMGNDAIPLIIEELRNDPDHWFWALKSITGEDPVRPEDRGNLQKMTEAWLNWAEEHEY